MPKKKTKSTESKTINFQNTGNYYNDLAIVESSNKVDKTNKKFLGLYQLGPAALMDIGYIDKNTKNWTGKNGINSKQDFLNNRIAQDIAIREYHQINWNKYLKEYQKYEGQEINGIKLTKSGLISCAHLVGQDRLKNFIDSKGTVDKKDGNLVPCSEYLKKFSGYSYDFSTDALQAQLQQNQQAAAQQPPVATPQPDTAAQAATAAQTTAPNPQQPPAAQAQPAPAQPAPAPATTQPEPQPAQNTQVAPVQQPPQPQAQPAPAPATTQLESQPTPTPQPQQSEQKPAATNDKVYEIQPSDNLGTIAANNGITLEALLNIPGNENFKANPDQIKPGEKVNIAATEAKSEEQPPAQETNTQQEQTEQKQEKQAPQILPNPIDNANKLQEMSNDTKRNELEREIIKLDFTDKNKVSIPPKDLDPMSEATHLDTTEQNIRINELGENLEKMSWNNSLSIDPTGGTNIDGVATAGVNTNVLPDIGSSLSIDPTGGTNVDGVATAGVDNNIGNGVNLIGDSGFIP